MAEPVTGPADIIIVNATILPMGGGRQYRMVCWKSAATGSPNSDLQAVFDVSTGKKRIDARGAS